MTAMDVPASIRKKQVKMAGTGIIALVALGVVDVALSMSLGPTNGMLFGVTAGAIFGVVLGVIVSIEVIGRHVGRGEASD